jgi:sporulation protein YlmC with PRC-barrel domain
MADVREMSRGLVKIENILGVDVQNTAKESLGKIEEVVLDKLTGHARYVVLSFGGVFGLGDKLFALPWNALHYDTNEECFIVNISKDKLKNAPGFDKDSWPNMADKTWEETIYNYYGTRPYWKDGL